VRISPQSAGRELLLRATHAWREYAGLVYPVKPESDNPSRDR